MIPKVFEPLKFNCISTRVSLLLLLRFHKYLLSTPMGVDYVVIGFDMEVQPLVTHNAA